eukprot:gene5249-2411_t
MSDLSNTGSGRFAGSCTAASFLRQFVEKDVRWAHLDVAGPNMRSAEAGYLSKGCSGHSVWLLYEWLGKKRWHSDEGKSTKRKPKKVKGRKS